MTASNWWMFHGDVAHTGEAAGSAIDKSNVGTLKLLHSIDVPGSILSTPAVVDGYVYVGLSNSLEAAAQNGGQFLKVELATGTIAAAFNWNINPIDRDSHGFCGMGRTPAVVHGKVYFSAFDGKVYCLNQSDLTLVWRTDLRYADLAHNQPVTNDFPNGDVWSPVNPGLQTSSSPKAAGWSSPLVVNNRVYVGFGEGENPYIYGFVYCLDADTGNVIWIYCTCQYELNVTNLPNQLPLEAVDPATLPPMFTTVDSQPVAKGASVWSGIAYDPDLDRLYAATGNPNPDGTIAGATLGYSIAVLALDGATGAFQGLVQIPAGTFDTTGTKILPGANGNGGSYRQSDADVDIGGAPTLWKVNGKKVVGIGCKNGCYLTFDPTTFDIVRTRQLLPTMLDGTQIEAVDPHFIDQAGPPVPPPPNAVSNQVQAENFHGTYSTAALCTARKKIFIGVGGNNYHFIAAGIDTASTPFIRALDWETLDDAWPLTGDPPRYAKALEEPNNPLYKDANSGESGISVPAVVNDVVFMSTTLVALYAFSADDGSLLWSDVEGFGHQTGGMSGGYGYCMGPAIAGNYVVAGALVRGGSGGVLNIYTLPS
jgi:outer membrane protein assembly factor BamB